jgi:hypothetical protein
MSFGAPRLWPAKDAVQPALKLWPRTNQNGEPSPSTVMVMDVRFWESTRRAGVGGPATGAIRAAGPPAPDSSHSWSIDHPDGNRGLV